MRKRKTRRAAKTRRVSLSLSDLNGGEPYLYPTPRVFLVTGATGAIGQAIAHQLAQSPDHRVVLPARNEAKAQAAAVYRQLLRYSSQSAISAAERVFSNLSRRRTMTPTCNWSETMMPA